MVIKLMCALHKMIRWRGDRSRHTANQLANISVRDSVSKLGYNRKRLTVPDPRSSILFLDRLRVRIVKDIPKFL